MILRIYAVILEGEHDIRFVMRERENDPGAIFDTMEELADNLKERKTELLKANKTVCVSFQPFYDIELENNAPSKRLFMLDKAHQNDLWRLITNS